MGLSSESELLDSLPDGVLVLGPDGTLRAINPAARQLLALQVGDAIAEAGEPLARLAERATLEPVRGRVLLGGEPVELRGAPLGASGGGVLCLRPPGPFARRERHATEASHWASLAAGLAHELRNPLAAVKAAAALLAKDPVGETSGQLVGVIDGETRRIEALLEGLLDLARPCVPSPSLINLHALLEARLGLFALQCPAKVHLRRHFDPSLPQLSLDPEQLTQVLQNLLQNAQTAVGASGEIVLSTGVETGLTQGAPGARRSLLFLRVEDSGPGFDPRVLAAPFTPFLTTRPGGTGLGLALCRRLIEAQGGLIELANRAQGGARVSLLLPSG